MASFRRGLVIAFLGLTALATLLPTAASATVATTAATAAASTTLRAGSPTGDAFSGAVSLTGTATILGQTCDTTYSGTLDSSGAGSIFGITSNCPIYQVNLPWAVSITYSPVPGGPDGTITIGSFRVSVTLSPGITCVYGGNLTGALYNPDNPNRPDPSSPYMQAKFTNVSLSKVSGSFLCPGTTTYSGLFYIISADGPIYITS